MFQLLERLGYLRDICTSSYAQANHKISNDDDVVLAKTSPITIPDTGKVQKITQKYFPDARVH